jgi:hypothetical protein
MVKGTSLEESRTPSAVSDLDASSGVGVPISSLRCLYQFPVEEIGLA